VRGGFEVDIAWKDGKLTEAMIRSVNGTKTTVRYLDITTEVSLRPGEKRSLTF
jgi:alpha-L-fucosidase 2